MKSQNIEILAHLKSGKTITAIQALNKFNCFRLAARIKNLRDAGHDIGKQMIGEGKRFAEYKLTK